MAKQQCTGPLSSSCVFLGMYAAVQCLKRLLALCASITISAVQLDRVAGRNRLLRACVGVQPGKDRGQRGCCRGAGPQKGDVTGGGSGEWQGAVHSFAKPADRPSLEGVTEA